MSLHHRFIDAAKRYPKKLAFADKTTGKRVTFHQALIGAFLFSKRMRALDDKYVGIMLPTSVGSGLAILGALFAGKTPVMLNYSTGAATNVKFAQNKIGFKAVITSRKLLEKIGCPLIEGMIFVEDWVAGISAGEKIATALKTVLPAAVLRRQVATFAPNDTLAIMFTSGSEKEPKGVQLTHRNVESNLEGIIDRFHFTSDESMLAVLPVFHVFGFTVCFWLPVTLGMTTVAYANPLDFKTVMATIRDERPTIFVGTPYFLMNYLKVAQRGDFESFRYIVTGADKTPDWLHQSMWDNHNKEIIEGYGATETSPVVATNLPGASRRGSIGIPLKGVDVRIGDLDTGAPVPVGQEGRIFVKGDLVMKGYFGDPAQTAERIVDGWYDTGDVGMFDEHGYLWHRGRLKRFVKIGGEMVSLVQVELAAERVLPEHVECCAVEVPNELRGSNIVLALTQAVDEKHLRDRLAEALPALALPRKFLVFGELPKMGSGKIDFRAVTEAVRQCVAQNAVAAGPRASESAPSQAPEAPWMRTADSDLASLSPRRLQ